MTWLKIALLAFLLSACGSGLTPVPREACSGVQVPVELEPPSPEAGFLEQYASTSRFRLGLPGAIQITPGGDAVLYLRSGPRSFVRDLYEFDAETGEERALLSADQILEGADEQLSPEARARRERRRIVARGITSYELSQDGRRILVPLSGGLYIVDRESGRTQEVGQAEGYPNDAHLSPDGTQVACVRNGDLHVIDIASGRERRLTTSAAYGVENGLPEFVAQEEMRRYRGYWWSPDSQSIAYQQTDTTEVDQLHIVDPMHPEQPPHAAPYPRPGTNNATVRLGIISVRGGRTRWVQWDHDRFPYLATVRWSAGAPLTAVVQDRAQHEEQILIADERAGTTRVIHTERDDAWLNLDQDVPRWIDDGRAFLWTTERDGAWQLELRDRNGELVRTLTEPGLGFERLLHVDEERGLVWISASAEPTESHIVHLPLSGDVPTRATAEPGVHEAVVRGGLRVVTSMPRAGGRTTRVFRGEVLIGELRSVAEEPPFVPQLERVTVGERDYRAVLVRPRDFERGRRYPVLVSVYGGPHARTVRATPRRYLMQQWYADHGYVVVSIDGRGTPARGREWERAIDGDFIEVPLADQVEALTALGERFSEMDMERVGIYGWSFGGYFSAMAVMQRPDVFKAAVAGAPVADWRDYDTHYTERYIGIPAENEAGYENGSVLTHAGQLQHPLLIIHGTADDNVYFTHAIKMSNVLLRAGRPHDFLPLSGFTHMVAEPEVTRNLHERIIGFFERHL